MKISELQFLSQQAVNWRSRLVGFTWQSIAKFINQYFILPIPISQDREVSLNELLDISSFIIKKISHKKWSRILKNVLNGNMEKNLSGEDKAIFEVLEKLNLHVIYAMLIIEHNHLPMITDASKKEKSKKKSLLSLEHYQLLYENAYCASYSAKALLWFFSFKLDMIPFVNAQKSMLITNAGRDAPILVLGLKSLEKTSMLNKDNVEKMVRFTKNASTIGRSIECLHENMPEHTPRNLQLLFKLEEKSIERKYEKGSSNILQFIELSASVNSLTWEVFSFYCENFVPENDILVEMLEILSNKNLLTTDIFNKLFRGHDYSLLIGKSKVILNFSALNQLMKESLEYILSCDAVGIAHLNCFSGFAKCYYNCLSFITRDPAYFAYSLISLIKIGLPFSLQGNEILSYFRLSHMVPIVFASKKFDLVNFSKKALKDFSSPEVAPLLKLSLDINFNAFYPQVLDENVFFSWRKHFKENKSLTFAMYMIKRHKLIQMSIRHSTGYEKYCSTLIQFKMKDFASASPNGEMLEHLQKEETKLEQNLVDKRLLKI